MEESTGRLPQQTVGAVMISGGNYPSDLHAGNNQLQAVSSQLNNHNNGGSGGMNSPGTEGAVSLTQNISAARRRRYSIETLMAMRHSPSCNKPLESLASTIRLASGSNRQNYKPQSSSQSNRANRFNSEDAPLLHQQPNPPLDSTAGPSNLQQSSLLGAPGNFRQHQQRQQQQQAVHVVPQNSDQSGGQPSNGVSSAPGGIPPAGGPPPGPSLMGTLPPGVSAEVTAAEEGAALNSASGATSSQALPPAAVAGHQAEDNQLSQTLSQQQHASELLENGETMPPPFAGVSQQASEIHRDPIEHQPLNLAVASGLGIISNAMPGPAHQGGGGMMAGVMAGGVNGRWPQKMLDRQNEGGPASRGFEPSGLHPDMYMPPSYGGNGGGGTYEDPGLMMPPHLPDPFYQGGGDLWNAGGEADLWDFPTDGSDVGDIFTLGDIRQAERAIEGNGISLESYADLQTRRKMQEQKQSLGVDGSPDIFFGENSQIGAQRDSSSRFLPMFQGENQPLGGGSTVGANGGGTGPPGVPHSQQPAMLSSHQSRPNPAAPGNPLAQNAASLLQKLPYAQQYQVAANYVATQHADKSAAEKEAMREHILSLLGRSSPNQSLHPPEAPANAGGRPPGLPSSKPLNPAAPHFAPSGLFSQNMIGGDLQALKRQPGVPIPPPPPPADYRPYDTGPVGWRGDEFQPRQQVSVPQTQQPQQMAELAESLQKILRQQRPMQQQPPPVHQNAAGTDLPRQLLLTGNLTAEDTKNVVHFLKNNRNATASAMASQNSNRRKELPIPLTTADMLRQQLQQQQVQAQVQAQQQQQQQAAAAAAVTANQQRQFYELKNLLQRLTNQQGIQQSTGIAAGGMSPPQQMRQQPPPSAASGNAAVSLAAAALARDPAQIQQLVAHLNRYRAAQQQQQQQQANAAGNVVSQNQQATAPWTKQQQMQLSNAIDVHIQQLQQKAQQQQQAQQLPGGGTAAVNDAVAAAAGVARSARPANVYTQLPANAGSRARGPSPQLGGNPVIPGLPAGTTNANVNNAMALLREAAMVAAAQHNAQVAAAQQQQQQQIQRQQPQPVPSIGAQQPSGQQQQQQRAPVNLQQVMELLQKIPQNHPMYPNVQKLFHASLQGLVQRTSQQLPPHMGSSQPSGTSMSSEAPSVPSVDGLMMLGKENSSPTMGLAATGGASTTAVQLQGNNASSSAADGPALRGGQMIGVSDSSLSINGTTPAGLSIGAVGNEAPQQSILEAKPITSAQGIMDVVDGGSGAAVRGTEA